MDPGAIFNPPPLATAPPVPFAAPPPPATVVVNPTPNITQPAPSHPPYAQMITEAITALKERDGSSKRAISKYIDSVYSKGSLPKTHQALLTHHLKRLKEEGHLVMVKHSYKVARSAATTQPHSNGPKRGPGRPPKPKPANDAAAAPVQQQQAQVNATVGPAAVTGTVPDYVFASLGLVDGPAAAVVAVPKKSPGRPRKTGVAGDGGVAGQPKGKRGPGRPPKNAGPGASVGKPRGRPRKAANGTPGRPRGRPPKNVAAPAAGAAGGAAPGALVATTTAYIADGATLAQPKKPRRLSGKPLGRPKKNPTATPTQASSSLQQLVSYQEIKGKLEIFQSKIKQTVSVLKPCLDSQTAASALGALQELEELAAMDITVATSFRGQQPPVQNQV